MPFSDHPYRKTRRKQNKSLQIGNSKKFRACSRNAFFSNFQASVLGGGGGGGGGDLCGGCANVRRFPKPWP